MFRVAINVRSPRIERFLPKGVGVADITTAALARQRTRDAFIYSGDAQFYTRCRSCVHSWRSGALFTGMSRACAIITVRDECRQRRVIVTVIERLPRLSPSSEDGVFIRSTCSPLSFAIRCDSSIIARRPTLNPRIREIERALTRVRYIDGRDGQIIEIERDPRANSNRGGFHERDDFDPRSANFARRNLNYVIRAYRKNSGRNT